MQRPRSPLFLCGAAALVASIAVGVYFFSSQHSLPQPGTPKYERFVESFEIGVAALDADVPQVAQKSLTEALGIIPEEPATWANRGVLSIRDGRLDEALGDLREAERLAPGNATIQQLLGLAQQRRGRLADAEAHLRQAISLDPKNIRALYRLAQVIDQQHNADGDREYQRLLDQILAIQPDNLFVLQNRLRVALRRGDRAAARETVDRLSQLSVKWSQESKDELVEFQRASAAGNEKDVSALALPLINLLRAERGFATDASAVDASDSLAGTVIEQFLLLAPPRHAPAAPDMDLTFSATPFAAPLSGRWDVIAPVWLRKESQQPTLIAANAQQIREIGGKLTLSSVPVTTQGLLAIDWNNDFRVDLLLAGPEGLRFFEQQADGGFAEVTAKTGLSRDVLHGDYAAAWAADIDLDGDLDIVLARRSGSPLLLRNNFDGTFKPEPIFEGVDGARAFVWADLDRDGAPDAILLDARGQLHVYANERSGRFRPWPVKSPAGAFVALAVGDMQGDGIIALLALRDDGALIRIADRDKRSAWDVSQLASWEQFPASMKLGAVRLLVADLDNNGSLDLIASGPQGSRVWLAHEAGGKFAPLVKDLPGNIHAAVDLDGRGRLDLIGLDSEGRPMRWVNAGKKSYHWQVVRPVAQSLKGDNRINSFGIGGDVEIRSGSYFLKQPIAGPVVHFGLGDRPRSDVVRIEWLNGTSQTEFSPPVDASLEAQQRLKGSCPFLFAWNGERFVFVADFMWSTPLGMYINAQDNGRIAQTTEWVKIRGDQMVPRDGYYELRVNANLWETHYFDHLSLIVVDHPQESELVVDERFSPASSGPVMHLTDRPKPVSRAIDPSGADVTELISAVDGKYLDHCGRGEYQGLTREHWVEVELADEITGDGPLYLLATGWVHPTDSSINFALEQGQRDPPHGLVLDVPDGKGGWKIGRDNLGFPAGKNKTMAIRLDGIDGSSVPRRFRLRTNMEIYWDALRVARGQDESTLEKSQLLAETADLRYRGIIEMSQANRSSPEIPHYDRIVAHGQFWRDLIGFHTRYGDVRELLQKTDDRYVILCAGDEVVLRFKAPAPPRMSMKRDYIWVSDGWVKDGDYNTRFGKTVLPLPSHDAQSYDVAPGRLEDDRVYQRHAPDWKDFHTRYVTPELYEQGLRGPRSPEPSATNPRP